MDFSKMIADYQQRLTEQINQTDVACVNEAIHLLLQARDADKQVFVMGNGGSGASASHIVGDFNKGLSLGKERARRWRFISLVDNSSTVLSLANDVSYNDIFVEQLKNFLNPGDLVIAISGSGNSENVLRAVRYAKECGNTTIGMTAYDGGKLKQEADIRLHFAINDMQIAEDLHMSLLHLMFSVLYHSNC